MATTSNDPAYCIGLMSGTSADGIDAALVEISRIEIDEAGIGQNTSVIATHEHAYNEDTQEKIFAFFESGNKEIDRLGSLDRELGEQFAEAAIAVLKKSHLPREKILAIGSHGQTIRHRASRHGNRQNFSLQIADPNTIAHLTGMLTIADFRRRDICGGGQGAPLTPAFHNANFRSSQHNRAIINIGGIANITHLPADTNVSATGCDIGPGNCLMDEWIRAIHPYENAVSFDKGGQWAAMGNVHKPLLEHLLSDPFFHAPAPKSTGREVFNLSWLRDKLQQVTSRLAPEDVQASLAEVTAESIARAVSQHQEHMPTEIFLCGGGAHNTYLCDRIRQHLPNMHLSDTEALGIHPDWVEASAFAWLAYRRINTLSGNLPAVTGASRDLVLGGMYHP